MKKLIGYEILLSVVVLSIFFLLVISNNRPLAVFVVKSTSVLVLAIFLGIAFGAAFSPLVDSSGVADFLITALSIGLAALALAVSAYAGAIVIGITAILGTSIGASTTAVFPATLAATAVTGSVVLVLFSDWAKKYHFPKKQVFICLSVEFLIVLLPMLVTIL